MKTLFATAALALALGAVAPSLAQAECMGHGLTAQTKRLLPIVTADTSTTTPTTQQPVTTQPDG